MVIIKKLINLYAGYRGKKIADYMRNGNYKKKPSSLFLIPTPTGFTINKRESDDSYDIKFVDVLGIKGFKRDFLTTDCVCVSFEMSNEKIIEINEEMDGFAEVMAHAAKIIPECIAFEDWYLKIIQPAFKTNLTEIYKKQVI